MKTLFTLFVLLFSSSVVAYEFTLTCLSDNNFLTVFKIDKTNLSMVRLSSKNLNNGDEWNNINANLDIIYVEDNFFYTFDRETSNTRIFGTLDLNENIYIDTAHYSKTYDGVNYTYTDVYECIRG
tara:strand:- start:560 stop:934 length:375 start_codon:yes stop_codon:yes gene_type:complete